MTTHACPETEADSIRRLEERFRLATDAAEIGVWDIDLRTGALSWDRTMHTLFGIDEAEFGGTFEDWRRAVHPDDVAASTKKFEDAIGTGAPFDDEFRIVTPTGEVKVIRARAQVFCDEGGAALRAVGVNYDISALKVAEHRAIAAAERAEETHERLTRLTNNVPAALFEYREAPDGAISFPFFNSRLPDMLGVSADQVRDDGASAFMHLHPDDLQGVVAAIEASKDDLTPFNTRYRVCHPERGERWYLASTQPTREADGGTIWFGNLFDVTEQEAIEREVARASEELKRAHARLSTIANVAPAGLFELHVHDDQRFDIPYFSDRFAELLRLSRDEVEAEPTRVFDSLHPEDVKQLRRTIQAGADRLEPWAVRVRLRGEDETWLNANAAQSRQGEGRVIFTGVLADVTEDAAREERLRQLNEATERMRALNEHQALHDGLTGLPNRRFYDQQLAELLALSRAAPDQVCTLVRIDLDHFKHVNDTLGHEAGDSVLIRVAEVLRTAIGPNDFAARIGGDEFSILMQPGASEADAEALVQRVRGQLNEPHFYDGRQCRFGASFGIASAADLSEIGHDIQMFADAALYKAKSSGRNQAQVFTPQMHEQILTDRQLATEIQEGLERGEFVPYFQAQVAAETEQVVGVEVLLRWNHPSRGVLTPAAFMHVAEHLRLVPDLDRAMMERCQVALLSWASEGLIIPKMSFNISAGRFAEPGLIDMAQTLADGPTTIVFELLESILVEDESDVLRLNIAQIQERGIEIEIDDFGSGHASIVSLMQIQPAALKIDQRLIAPLHHDARVETMVRAIIEMAKTLGIATIAEGVETPQQANRLKRMGCDVLQGFLYSKPSSHETFTTLAKALGSQAA